MLLRVPVVLCLALLLLAPQTALAQSYPYCRPGQKPTFLFGFKALAGALGEVMGEPLECEHPNSANGDVLQRTSKGLAFWRKRTNTPTFTDGYRHWALTAAGLVYWEGPSVDPPPASRRPEPPPPAPPPRPDPAAPPPGYRYPIVEAPQGSPSVWTCLRANPSCARDPWWVEWNELQYDDFVQYAFVGPGLVTEFRFIEAIWLLWKWEEGKFLLSEAAKHGVIIYALPFERSAFASYSFRLKRIAVNEKFTEVSTWMLADILAHELKHAADHRAGAWMSGSYADCIAGEQVAYQTERRFVSWLARNMGWLPDPYSVAARLSSEDFDLYYDLYVNIITPQDVNLSAIRMYHEDCAA